MSSSECPRFIFFTVKLFSGQEVRNDTEKQHRPIIPNSDRREQRTEIILSIITHLQNWEHLTNMLLFCYCTHSVSLKISDKSTVYVQPKREMESANGLCMFLINYRTP